ncbi:MAG: contractile injection system tape measure protein, partial [Chitinophaga rupis]
KAVHLLQYLVDGKEEHPEQELALNKILCGLPIDEPVPLYLSFTEQEKEVSAELLNVLRVQWEKLKNTSIEGVRVSFLQRQGALTETAEGWKLRVEQRAYDVLLQTLPWGLGMIRLSWMKKIIYTEWS